MPWVGADGAGQQAGIEGQRGQEEPPRRGELAIAFGDGLDHGDGAQAGKARLAWGTAGAVQPGHVVADKVAAGLEAAMVGVGGLEDRQGLGLGAVEEQGNLLGEAPLVVLEREEIIPTAL